MDEATIREHAERHGNAVAAGDMRTAGADLTPEAQAQAPGVMKNFPADTNRASILRIKQEDDAFDVYISYEGSETDLIVVSRWEERDGRPMITDLSLG